MTNNNNVCKCCLNKYICTNKMDFVMTKNNRHTNEAYKCYFNKCINK